MCTTVFNCIVLRISELIIDFISLYLSFRYFRFVWLSVFPIILGMHYLRFIFLKYFNQPMNRIEINLTLLALILFTLLRGQPEYPVYSLEESFPVETMNYWENAKLEGHVWCDWNWSGYVIWRSNGKAKVFSDTRIEPFSETVLELGRFPSTKILLITEELKILNTEYLLLPAEGLSKTIHQIELNKIGDIIYKGNKSILIKLK